MAEPVDSPIPLNGSLESHIKGQNAFVVYTHGIRTRNIIAALFVFYLVFFVMFLHSILEHFKTLENLPPVFAALEAANNPWISYLVATLGILIALSFLLYFLWALVDIWGLQICLSPVELRVQNTITLTRFRPLMGVGSLRMVDIQSIRGGRFLTYITGKNVLGKEITVRFSPVENVDNLIAGILSHAPDAKVVE